MITRYNANFFSDHKDFILRFKMGKYKLIAILAKSAAKWGGIVMNSETERKGEIGGEKMAPNSEEDFRIRKRTI